MTYEDVKQEVQSNQSLAPFSEIIESILDSDTSFLTDKDAFEVTSKFFLSKIESQEQMIISELIKNFESNQFTKEQVTLAITAYQDDLLTFLNKIQPEEKRKLFSLIFNKVVDISNKAIEKYHNYNIILPMTLEEGAQVPTYAHDSDAAADLYAADDITIPAHSISNMIRTGVHIALPENWVAIVVPRSSIGMKTGLRLSNSQGVIDSKVNFCA